MSLQIAQLKQEIRARRFRVMEIDIEIGRRADEIRAMIGSSLTPNRNIQFRLISGLAGEVATLQEERAKLIEEIEQGEKELAD